MTDAELSVLNWNSLGVSSLEEIEQVAGAWTPRLSPDYLRFLTTSGGGGIDADVKLTKKRHGRDTSRVEEILSAGTATLGLRFWLNSASGEECLEREAFPFATAPGGDLYCLDLRDQGVLLWDHGSGEFLTVADSFSDFLARLVPIKTQESSARRRAKIRLDPDLL